MGKKKATVNKSQMIRDYLGEHPDTQNKDVAEALKQYGVNAQDVANLKARLKVKQKGSRKKPGRQAGSTAGSDNTLDIAIKFVEQSGSLKQAKAALEKIERIKSL